MELIETTTEFGDVGYPLIVFYLIVLIGFLLIIYRPYWAFLFSVFCLASRNFHAAVFTRTELFGPYLNLNDLLLWIALFAMLMRFFRIKKPIWAPKILLAIFALTLTADFQSLFKYGIVDDVLRGIWSTTVFPILFLVAGNMVKDVRHARSFYWALFLGAVVASIQHMLFAKSVTYSDIFTDGAQIRTISYIMSGGLFLVIGSIFTVPDRRLSYVNLILYYLGLTLIGLSYILSLTRGIYVSAIATLILLPFLIGKKVRFRKSVYNIVTLAIGTMFVIGLLFPNLELSNILAQRIESFVYRETFPSAFETRLLGAQTELNLWLNTSFILGVGSCLPPELTSLSLLDVFQTGALGHVGFATYLAHFGILGIVVYGILLPVLTIKIARRYHIDHFLDYGGQIAVIAIVSALMDLIGLAWSYHHLGAVSHVPGLIYGAMWGLHRSKITKRNFNSPDDYWVRYARNNLHFKNGKYL